jgi:hypothetical protein
MYIKIYRFTKLFCQQMHYLLKHKMLEFVLKYLFMAPTCFGSFGPSSGSIHWNLAKVIASLKYQLKHVVKIVVVQWHWKFQFVVCALGAVQCTRRTAPSAHTTQSHAAQHPMHTLRSHTPHRTQGTHYTVTRRTAPNAHTTQSHAAQHPMHTLQTETFIATAQQQF